MVNLQIMDNCSNCTFFRLGDRMGLCQRYPQTVNKSSNDICGEWRIEPSLALEALVQLMVDPIIAIDPPKKRGRPLKR